MELRIFDFIGRTTDYIENMRGDLEAIQLELELYFNRILADSDEGFINMSSRIKDMASLKEKIIRNSYYKNYDEPQQLIDNLSDLIGIRLECRFIDDEYKLYKLLLRYFTKVNDEGYYYNQFNPAVSLALGEKQPQTQRNGFTIYKIDGLYRKDGLRIRFELQIKSLVNLFWSEIEHKIIYKNDAYVLADGFLKDIMVTVKNIFTMLDNQLLILYKRFNSGTTISPDQQQENIRALLSKSIFDIFAHKMRQDIGFIVEFRSSCDLIIDYILMKNKVDSADAYRVLMVDLLTRLQEIAARQIEFNSEIAFERPLRFDGAQEKQLGDTISALINVDYRWHLFFTILFELEPGNNAEDFEHFIVFLSEQFSASRPFRKLHKLFHAELAQEMEHSLLMEMTDCFARYQNIDFIHPDRIEMIQKVFGDIVKFICMSVRNEKDWQLMRPLFLGMLSLRLGAMLGMKTSEDLLEECVDAIETHITRPRIRLHLLDYIMENVASPDGMARRLEQK